MLQRSSSRHGHVAGSGGGWAGVLLGLSVLAGCRPMDRAVPEPSTNPRVERAERVATPATRASAEVPITARAPEAEDAATAAATPDAVVAPATVERLLVPGDLAASVVRSRDGAPPTAVFLPGVCSNASAYLHTFPEAARLHGGVLGIEGDQRCGGRDDFRTFSWDAARLHARIEAALAAAGVAEIPREGVTVVGYSQGAALAEQLVQRWPARYTRIVLIGAPSDPAPRSFARTRALVTMSCDRDVPSRMKRAAQATARAGTPATYFEMPGCTHGNVTDGERIFDAVFDWLGRNERPLDPSAAAVRIAGTPTPLGAAPGERPL